MYESPLILIIVAVVLFCIITILRNFLPDKRRWWQFLIPLVVLIAAFAVDHGVHVIGPVHAARSLVAV